MITWVCRNCGRLISCNGKCLEEGTRYYRKPNACGRICHYCLYAEKDSEKNENDFCDRKLLSSEEINPSYRWKDERIKETKRRGLEKI